MVPILPVFLQSACSHARKASEPVYDHPSHFQPGFVEPSALKGMGGDPQPRSAGSEYFETTHDTTSPLAI